MLLGSNLPVLWTSPLLFKGGIQGGWIHARLAFISPFGTYPAGWRHQLSSKRSLHQRLKQLIQLPLTLPLLRPQRLDLFDQLALSPDL
jgi:hypothetical protein